MTIPLSCVYFMQFEQINVEESPDGGTSQNVNGIVSEYFTPSNLIFFNEVHETANEGSKESEPEQDYES